MKFIISSNNLKRVLTHPVKTSEKNSNKQILSHVLLEASDDQLIVIGTDMERTAKCSSEVVKVFEPGKITCDARKLSSIASNMPDCNATLEFKDDSLIVRFDRSRFKISTLPVEDFPLPSKEHTIASINGTEAAFFSAMASLYAMANQDVRYYLNGLFVDFSDGVNFAATDGHRLAVGSSKDLTINQEVPTSNIPGIIIPRAAALDIRGLLSSKSDNEITISIQSLTEDGHPNRVSIKKERLELTSTLIDGKFPDYCSVLPNSSEVDIAVADKQNLLSCLNRAIILSNEKFKGGKLDFKSNQLTVYSQNQVNETAKEEIDIEYSGNNIEIGFNLHYLIEAIKVCEGEKIEIGLLNESSAASVVSSDTDHNDLLNVVMPVRI